MGIGWGLNFPGAWVQLPVLGCLFLGLPFVSCLVFSNALFEREMVPFPFTSFLLWRVSHG